MAKKLITVDGKVVKVNNQPLAIETNNLVEKLIQEKKTTYYLFHKFAGTSVDEYISYSSTEGVTDMTGMFHSNSNLIKAPNLNTDSVTNMSIMFHSCKKMTDVPLYNTTNVTNMAQMFYDCDALKTIPKFDTSNVVSMSNMFYSAGGLASLPDLDTSNVASMDNMLRGCTSLLNVKLNTDSLTNMRYMFMSTPNIISVEFSSIDNLTQTNSGFSGCYSLVKWIIRNMTKLPVLENVNTFNNCYHFTGTKNATYNPDGLKDGRIYIPDEWVDQVKAATNWSTYADIIVPLSTLEE